MSKPTNTTSDNIAISGYDPVSYYKDSPAKGERNLSVENGGVTYLFANEANKSEFEANPGAFVPQYGGYCATAMSEGKIFEVDPTRYKVNDGKLFLFYRGEHGDTLPEWEEDEANRFANAENHWKNESFVEHA